MQMVKLMQWWLIAKPAEAPARGLLELVREQRVIIIRQNNGQAIPT